MALSMAEETRSWDTFFGDILPFGPVPALAVSMSHPAEENRSPLDPHLEANIDGNVMPFLAIPVPPSQPAVDQSDPAQVQGNVMQWQFHTMMQGRYDEYRNFKTTTDGRGTNPPCLRCSRPLRRPQSGGDMFYCVVCKTSTGDELSFNIKIHKDTGQLLIRQGTSKQRGPYLCAFCGAPKKGHNNACMKVAAGAAQTASFLPGGDDAELDQAWQEILQDQGVSGDIFSGSMSDLVASTEPAAAARPAYQHLEPLTPLKRGRFILASGRRIRVVHTKGWLGTIGSFYVPSYELRMNRVFFFKVKGNLDFNVLRQRVLKRTSQLYVERYDGVSVQCNAFVALLVGSAFRIAAFRVEELVTFDHLIQEEGVPWHFEIKMQKEQTMEYMPNDNDKARIVAKLRENMAQ